MKSYRELSGRYLKNQKKRTILTIIGVVLSVSLLCAAGIMGESFRNMMVDNVRHQYGNYHVEYGGISLAQEQKLAENAKAEEVGFRMDAGLSSVTETQNILITACDRKFLGMHYIELSSGRFPQKENEIVLEQWIIDNMKSNPGLGDTIRLDFSTIDRDGGASALKNNTSRDFKLVGIFKNSSFTQFSGLSVGMVTDQTVKSILKTDAPEVNAEVRIRPNIPLQGAISEMTAAIGAKSEQVHQNSAMLTVQSQGSNNKANTAIIIVQLILMLVIIIATISVIYNAFHISVLERIHQFGVLRSVGTTPRQIRAIVLGEAYVLGAAGIPLGILFGILGVRAVIWIFSIQTATFFGGMTVVIDPVTLLLTAILGMATLLASALGPSITAGRVSPMEAILNTSRSDRVKARKKKHPILSLLFHVEGVMAYENLKRNKKRFFVTVFSMCIGIVLFVFFTYFMGLMNRGVNTSFQKDYAIDKPFSANGPGYTQSNYDEIAGIPGVKSVYRLMQQDETVLLTKGQVTEKYLLAATNGKQGSGSVNSAKQASGSVNSGKQASGGTYSAGGTQYYSLSAAFYGYRDRELKLCRDNLLQGRLDMKGMNRENGVLVSQQVMAGGRTINASELKVGDYITIVSPGSEAGPLKPVRLKVMGILDSMPMSYVAGPERFGIITTEEVFGRITGKYTFSRFDIEVSSSADKKAVASKLNEIAKSVTDGRLLDFTDSSVSDIRMEIAFILFGLVIVISIIGALNIINTISTNLILRTREFGILRAVGMTPAQIKRMIRLEGIFYGLISAFYGTVVGCALSWLVYHYTDVIRSSVWHLPWQAAAEAAVTAIIIGLAASAAPLRRITRMNVVESVRAEE